MAIIMKTFYQLKQSFILLGKIALRSDAIRLALLFSDFLGLQGRRKPTQGKVVGGRAKVRKHGARALLCVSLSWFYPSPLKMVCGWVYPVLWTSSQSTERRHRSCWQCYHQRKEINLQIKQISKKSNGNYLSGSLLIMKKATQRKYFNFSPWHA